MRIVTDNSSNWTHQVECRDCKSILEIEIDDVRQGLFGAMGDYDLEFYAECAACESLIMFREPYRELPGFVRRAAERKRAEEDQ